MPKGVGYGSTRKKPSPKKKPPSSRSHRATSQNLAKGGKGKAKIAKKRTSIRGRG